MNLQNTRILMNMYLINFLIVYAPLVKIYQNTTPLGGNNFLKPYIFILEHKLNQILQQVTRKYIQVFH